MKDDINKRLAEIRERAEKATPAPWESGAHLCCHDYFGEPHPVVVGPNEENAICKMDGDWAAEEHDADFIAHARTDIPWLLDRVEALQSKLAVAREAMAAILNVHQYEQMDALGVVKEYARTALAATEPGEGKR